jgi:hypothetical protein
MNAADVQGKDAEKCTMEKRIKPKQNKMEKKQNERM